MFLSTRIACWEEGEEETTAASIHLDWASTMTKSVFPKIDHKNQHGNQVHGLKGTGEGGTLQVSNSASNPGHHTTLMLTFLKCQDALHAAI